jgi:hypothetical protein
MHLPNPRLAVSIVKVLLSHPPQTYAGVRVIHALRSSFMHSFMVVVQAPSPTTDGAEDVQMRASTGDQAKHGIAAAAAAAGSPATPAIPVSTSADDVAFTAAPKSPAAVIAALPASAAAAAAVKPSPVPAAKATAKSAAAAAANAAKKARTSVGGSSGANKRKNKGSTAGKCLSRHTAVIGVLHAEQHYMSPGCCALAKHWSCTPCVMHTTCHELDPVSKWLLEAHSCTCAHMFQLYTARPT